MRVFRSIKDLPKFKNAVVTIGSFDGVHRGHQKIINRINQLAREVDGESVLVTFHPHPRKVIFPKDKSLNLLTTLEEKLALCETYGVDNVVVVPFSIEFSKQSPEEYIENFLIKSFRPSYVVIGYDHKFGLNRKGDINFLGEYETSANFKVIEIQKQELEDIAISSSKIRTALKEGDIQTANMFLGSKYRLSGKVVHGDKIGKTIGFPTANVKLSSADTLIPKDGVYAVKGEVGELPFAGMMYIGRRPTLSGTQDGRSIEVNIFDFDMQVYNDEISVQLVEHIRDDEKFDSLEELKEQLKRDEISAKSVLGLDDNDSSSPKKQDQVCVAILNWNGLEYLEAYLPQVLHSASSLINVAVIDNASTDESTAYLKEWHPEVQLIELTKNYGFAEGYNRGLKEVDAKYIVLLNSDVLVTEHWLDPILALLENDESIAACQPKILSLEDKDHFEYAGASGGYLDGLGYPYCRGRIFDTVEKDNGQYDTIQDIDWASGAAMVIRSEVYRNLAGLDKDFFAHMEEIDLCWRIRRAGYTIKVVPEAVVYHLGGGTLDYLSPRKVLLNFRNNLSMILKNESGAKLVWLFPTRLILDGVAGIKYLIGGQTAAFFAVIKAHLQVYFAMGHILRKRALYNRIIQKYKVGSPKARVGTGSILKSYYLQGKKLYSEL